MIDFQSFYKVLLFDEILFCYFNISLTFQFIRIINDSLLRNLNINRRT